MERDDEEWRRLTAELHFAQATLDAATTQVRELKAKVLSLAGERRTQGNGVLVFSTTRNTVDHKQIIKDHNIDPTPYTKASTSWSVKVTKAKGDAA